MITFFCSHKHSPKNIEFNSVIKNSIPHKMHDIYQIIILNSRL